MKSSGLPPLEELGRDLVNVTRWRVVVSLGLPFALVVGYFAFALGGHWLPAFGCMIALSFATYGSVSHDLVHRSLGLPRHLR
jgi:beta-carotene hydroxylase